MIQIPETTRKVQIHFREKGRLLEAYSGVESRGVESAEAAHRRKEHARKFPGDKLYGIEARQKGLFIGSGLEAFDGWTLVYASVEERCTKEYEYENDSGETCKHPSKPYKWFTFSFVKSAFPKTQMLGENTKNFLTKMLARGWTEIGVYSNPMVKLDQATGETTLVVDFAGADPTLPKHYELGEEIVMGIRRVINTTYQTKTKKVRPVAEQRVE